MVIVLQLRFAVAMSKSSVCVHVLEVTPRLAADSYECNGHIVIHRFS
jgi:hypothetical protein